MTRFAVGDRVRTRAVDPDHHTRLPRYARGQVGEVMEVQGSWPLADDRARRVAEPRVEAVYTVRFPAAAHHGIGLLAWAPLGRGVLTGKYTDGTPADSRGASPKLAPYVEARRNERSARIVQAVLTAADGLGTSPLAIALAWVRDRPGVASAVVGPRDVAQLAASVAAESVTLPLEIRAALDDVSR